LLSSLDASLARLGTDYVDLWFVHAPDPHTPITETVSAMKHAIASGRARYVGLSNFSAWQSAQVATMLEGDPGLAAAQVEYSLLARDIEIEMIPAAAGLGLGVLAWSALGRGVLTGKYRHSVPADSRAASPHLRGFVDPYLTQSARSIVEAVHAAAEGLGRTAAEVALAWTRDAPEVSSALIGARTPAQLSGLLSATDLDLPAEIRDVLDEVSQPPRLTLRRRQCRRHRRRRHRRRSHRGCPAVYRPPWPGTTTRHTHQTHRRALRQRRELHRHPGPGRPK